jgi:hypothetical protein
MAGGGFAGSFKNLRAAKPWPERVSKGFAEAMPHAVLKNKIYLRLILELQQTATGQPVLETWQKSRSGHLVHNSTECQFIM